MHPSVCGIRRIHLPLQGRLCRRLSLGRLPCKGSCHRQVTEGCGALPGKCPSGPRYPPAQAVCIAALCEGADDFHRPDAGSGGRVASARHCPPTAARPRRKPPGGRERPPCDLPSGAGGARRSSGRKVLRGDAGTIPCEAQGKDLSDFLGGHPRRRSIQIVFICRDSTKCRGLSAAARPRCRARRTWARRRSAPWGRR